MSATKINVKLMCELAVQLRDRVCVLVCMPVYDCVYYNWQPTVCVIQCAADKSYNVFRSAAALHTHLLSEHRQHTIYLSAGCGRVNKQLLVVVVFSGFTVFMAAALRCCLVCVSSVCVCVQVKSYCTVKSVNRIQHMIVSQCCIL